HARNASIRHTDRHFNAALALEQKADRGPLDVDVPVTQRGQAEGVVLLRVLLVADPRECRLEQPDDRRHDLLLGQPVATEVARDGFRAPRRRCRRGRLLPPGLHRRPLCRWPLCRCWGRYPWTAPFRLYRRLQGALAGPEPGDQLLSRGELIARKAELAQARA